MTVYVLIELEREIASLPLATTRSKKTLANAMKMAKETKLASMKNLMMSVHIICRLTPYVAQPIFKAKQISKTIEWWRNLVAQPTANWNRNFIIRHFYMRPILPKSTWLGGLPPFAFWIYDTAKCPSNISDEDISFFGTHDTSEVSSKVLSNKETNNEVPISASRVSPWALDPLKSWNHCWSLETHPYH